jgi:hypothetical protein
LGKVRGKSALAHAENFLQLSHGKLFALDHEQDAQAVCVGQDS